LSIIDYNLKGSKMNFAPVYDRVVVQRVEVTTTSAGGIVFAPCDTDIPDQGIVLAIGPGKKSEAGVFIATTIKVGEKVLFGKNGVTAVQVNGLDILVLREEDIFAVLED
jgi:chaperonin GroES